MVINELDHDAFLRLIDPIDDTSQLLLAHLVAMYLFMRPISCRERKHYTVTMYGIRMTSWIPGIYNTVPEEKRDFMEWPLWVSGLHGKKELECWSLAMAKPSR